MPNLTWKNGILFFVVAGLLLALVLLFQSPEQQTYADKSYTEFLALEKTLKRAVIRGDEIVALDHKGMTVKAIMPSDPGYPKRLAESGVDVQIVSTQASKSWLTTAVEWSLSFLWLIVLGVPLYRIARVLERGATGIDRLR